MKDVQLITIERTNFDDWDKVTRIEIQWADKNHNIQQVRKGDYICTVNYYELADLLYSQRIISQKGGYFFIPFDLKHDTNLFTQYKSDMLILNEPIGFVFNSFTELFGHLFKNDSKIEVDPYSGKHSIIIKNCSILDLDSILSFKLKSDIVSYDYGLIISLHWLPNKKDLEYVPFYLLFEDDIIFMRFRITDKIYIGDYLSLLFSNGEVVDYPFTKKPVFNKVDRKYEIDIPIYQEDIDLLREEPLNEFRITFNTEAKKPETFEIENSFFEDYTQQAIMAYVNMFVDLLKKLLPDYNLSRRTIGKTQTEYLFNWCYVYLMKDKANGYHKIGISNKPEYREKTLQSEKPSIEMLACKKFPTRKIAEAIESALHTAYSQQRVRGEWFNLNDEDVAAIIETLK